jgi:hypothetical protein
MLMEIGRNLAEADWFFSLPNNDVVSPEWWFRSPRLVAGHRRKSPSQQAERGKGASAPHHTQTIIILANFMFRRFSDFELRPGIHWQ